MATFQDVDIRMALARLRPGAAYQWTGTRGDSGYNSLDECIGEWRSIQSVPTVTEILAAWEMIEAESATHAAAEQALLDDFAAVVGRPCEALDEIELRTVVALLLRRLGGLNPDSTIRAFETWGQFR